MRRFKRILAGMFVSCLLAGWDTAPVYGAPPIAEPQPAYAVTVADDTSGVKTVSRGDVVDFALTVSGAAYRGAYVSLAFDGGALRYAADSLAAQNGFELVYAADGPAGTGTLQFAVVASEDGADGAAFATFRLEVAPNASSGEYPITLLAASVCGYDDVTLSLDSGGDAIFAGANSGMDLAAVAPMTVNDAVRVSAPVAPEAADFIVTGDTYTYDGAAHTAAVAKADGVGDVGAITVEYYLDGVKVDSPANAGLYEIRVSTGGTIGYDAASGLAVGTLTILPKGLTIIGLDASDKTYDGGTAATVMGIAALDGVVDGDAVTVVPGSAAFDDQNAGTGKTVTFSGYSLTGTDAGNYTLAAQPAAVTADIARAAATVRADNKTKTVGAPDPTLTATVSGLVGGDAAGIVAYTISRAAGEAAGTYAITPSGTAAQGNYNVVFANGVLTIKPCGSGGNGGNGGNGGSGAAATYPITVEPTEQGEVFASDQTAPAGKTITVTPAPTSGHRIASVAVTDGAGDQITVTPDGNGSYRFTMPAGPVHVSAVFELAPVQTTESGVGRLLNTDEHIRFIHGYEDGAVRPIGNITRAETAMMLYRLLRDQNVAITESFSDVEPDLWYTEAVLKLASLGIIRGYEDGAFRPERVITRAEFTAMANRFAYVTEGRISFQDVGDDYWAARQIFSAASYGWIEGYDDGTFRPENNITRGEAAAVLNRVLGRKADMDYVAAHRSELARFSDLREDQWYYADVVEAANGHDHTGEYSGERWTALKH